MSVYPSFDFAPYAQLLRTLMPRARGIYLYAPDADLIWSADGADLQDLRPVVLELLESARDSASIAGLTEAQQIALVHGIEKTPFFETLRTHTVMGFLGSPEYGGNKGGAGWAHIGFEDKMGFDPPFGAYDAAAERGAK